MTHQCESVIRQHGSWTYCPTIEDVHSKFGGKFDWLVFLEEDASVNVANLAKTLSEYNSDKEIHVGKALKDSNSVIIHHYDSPHILYAHPDAGFALSSSLVALIASKIQDLSRDHTVFPKDFSIDPQYELAKLINHLKDTYDDKVEPPELDETEIPLINDKRFCLKNDKECAAYPRNVNCGQLSDEDVISLSKKTLFAVKTCKKFHHERLSVIQDTWEGAALRLEYFSEEEDPKYGTTVLPGVVNTPRGHCGKTEAIIKHFVGLPDAEWLVIADDDTILSPRKTLEQLWCYGGSRKEPYAGGKGVHLGQRYGYRVATGKYGYDYITGGGGMVLDRMAAEKVVSGGKAKGCSCPRADSPDDMHLGACLANLGLSLVHSARFHQGRPEDYHPDLLADPLSFHKFWNTNPRKTYDKYFRESDEVLREHKKNLKLAQREEL